MALSCAPPSSVESVSAYAHSCLCGTWSQKPHPLAEVGAFPPYSLRACLSHGISAQGHVLPSCCPHCGFSLHHPPKLSESQTWGTFCPFPPIWTMSLESLPFYHKPTSKTRSALALQIEQWKSPITSHSSYCTCHGLKVWVSPEFICWSLNPQGDDGMWRRDIWEAIRS